jgi:hypothetical protein
MTLLKISFTATVHRGSIPTILNSPRRMLRFNRAPINHSQRFIHGALMMALGLSNPEHCELCNLNSVLRILSCAFSFIAALTIFWLTPSESPLY